MQSVSLCRAPVLALLVISALPSPAEAQNAPPPTPPILDPMGDMPICSRQPTIMLENVDDPDGDPVEYFLVVDDNPCFCTAQHQESGPVEEGATVTEWTLPRPLILDPEVGGSKTFYIQRWTNDGVEPSVVELSLFEVDPACLPGAPDDEEAEDTGDEEADRRGCGIAAPGSHAEPGALSCGALALLLAVLRRRRPHWPPRKGL